jgi:hypothetical protein
MAEANMAEANSITTARGIVTAILACVALFVIIGASAAAPICSNRICAEIEPINNPAYVHFRVRLDGGTPKGTSFTVVHRGGRQGATSGQLIYVPRGKNSTWVTIWYCGTKPNCTSAAMKAEISLTGLSGQRYEPNINRGGSDYRNFQVPIERYQSCLEACQADEKCKAYTYVRQGVQGRNSVCWLKNAVPAKNSDRCCVSGVIR